MNPKDAGQSFLFELPVSAKHCSSSKTEAARDVNAEPDSRMKVNCERSFGRPRLLIGARPRILFLQSVRDLSLARVKNPCITGYE